MPCDRNPCKNGGTCVLNGLNTSFVCNCVSGYIGIFKNISVVQSYLLKFYIGFTCDIIVTTTISTRNTATTMNNIQIEPNLLQGFTTIVFLQNCILIQTQLFDSLIVK